MELPHFLLGDNTDAENEMFIMHTQYPRFIWAINADDVTWLDELEGEEEDLVNEIANLLETAEAFYEREMKRHEAELI